MKFRGPWRRAKGTGLLASPRITDSYKAGSSYWDKVFAATKDPSLLRNTQARQKHCYSARKSINIFARQGAGESSPWPGKR